MSLSNLAVRELFDFGGARAPRRHERADNRKLWDAFNVRWPEGDEWLGGITGFQYGWAHNAVRWILDVEQVGNPALVTIDLPSEETGT